MLTGKAQDLFIKWAVKNKPSLINKTIKQTRNTADITIKLSPFFTFITIDETFGIYQDFADSLGYDIFILKSTKSDFGIDYESCISTEGGFYLLDEEYFKTRNEARTKAIEKLNEILNNENN